VTVLYGSIRPNRDKACRQKLFPKEHKPLTEKEVLAAWLRAHTDYKESVIERILKTYDGCPEAFPKISLAKERENLRAQIREMVKE